MIDGVDVHEESGGDDEIRSDEHHALQPVRLTVLDEEADEEDGEEDGKAMRKRYDEARGAIERALRGEGDSKNVAAKCRACPGTLLLNAGDMREHAKSKKHAKNLKRLGKADDDTFVCFYPAVKEDEGGEAAPPAFPVLDAYVAWKDPSLADIVEDADWVFGAVLE